MSLISTPRAALFLSSLWKVWRQKLPRRGYNTACSDISCRRKGVGPRFCAGKKKKKKKSLLRHDNAHDALIYASWGSKPHSTMVLKLNYTAYKNHELSVPNSDILNHKPGGSPTPSCQCELDSAQVWGHLRTELEAPGWTYGQQGRYSLSRKTGSIFSKGSE